MGMIEYLKNLFQVRKKKLTKPVIVQAIQAPESEYNKLKSENAILHRELDETKLNLMKTIQVSIDVLTDWEQVSRKLLYPHQHNVHSKNKEALDTLKEIFVSHHPRPVPSFSIDKESTELLYNVLFPTKE